MPVSLLVSEVAFGGMAINNPPNYSWTDYSNYPDLDLTWNYVRMNIIHFNSRLGVTLEVTGLVTLNAQGSLLLGPNDKVYVPCPPYCS